MLGSLSDLNRQQLNKYLDMLEEKNKVMNLTAIKDRDEMWIKHIEDSITVAEFIEKLGPKNLVDVGTGAGLPGLVLKILFPNIEVLLLDSLNKRLVFLDEVIKTLELNKIKTLHSRAEDATNLKNKDNIRERYDLAISRAVARLDTLCEFNLPFVKVGGHMIAMKGPGLDEELGVSKKAIEILGGKLKEIKNLKLSDDSERNIVVIEKIKKTPNKYPRSGNKAKTNPL